jgi:3-methyladenine DNA glycosylase AlkD
LEIRFPGIIFKAAKNNFKPIKMTSKEIMQQLEKMGSAQTKKIFLNHGAKEPFFGVNISDLKILQKKIKKDHRLSLELYDTGNGDAQYLAGLIADEKQISPKDLDKWVKNAGWRMITESTVPWIAADSGHGWKSGLEWIESKKENIAASGWSALSDTLAITPDDKLDLKQIEKLLLRVEKEIHKAQNRVGYCMNGFVIAVGCFVIPLSDKARATAKKIGTVKVFMGDTACKVPDAVTYIDKVIKMGRLGRKKKEARC